MLTMNLTYIFVYSKFVKTWRGNFIRDSSVAPTDLAYRGHILDPSDPEGERKLPAKPYPPPYIPPPLSEILKSNLDLLARFKPDPLDAEYANISET